MGAHRYRDQLCNSDGGIVKPLTGITITVEQIKVLHQYAIMTCDLTLGNTCAMALFDDLSDDNMTARMACADHINNARKAALIKRGHKVG